VRSLVVALFPLSCVRDGRRQAFQRQWYGASVVSDSRTRRRRVHVSADRRTASCLLCDSSLCGASFAQVGVCVLQRSGLWSNHAEKKQSWVCSVEPAASARRTRKEAQRRPEHRPAHPYDLFRRDNCVCVARVAFHVGSLRLTICVNSDSPRQSS
jgi:hypothetical protein